MSIGGRKFRDAVNFLPEISNRAGGQEQAEELPKFPIVLSEDLPE